MRNIIFILCAIFMFPVSCLTGISEKLVYSLSNCEIRENKLYFTVKNTSSVIFSDFSIYVEFYNANSSSDESDILIFQKDFKCSLECGQAEDFTINLLQDSDFFEIAEYETEDTSCENSIIIQKIYIKKINFEDGTQFLDRFGSWSF